MRAMDVEGEDSGIPESRVLIIMTGGTICMDYAKDVGYVPVSLMYVFHGQWIFRTFLCSLLICRSAGKRFPEDSTRSKTVLQRRFLS